MNARRQCVLGAALWLCACSSVDGINERALKAGTSDSSPVPVAAPAWQGQKKTEYRLGAQDLLEIEVFELEEPNKSRVLKTRVSQDGFIVLPLVGQVRALNRTAAQLQADIETALDAAAEDWVAVARETRRKRFGAAGPADFHERARQARFLQYRGFTSEQIRAALGPGDDTDS